MDRIPDVLKGSTFWIAFGGSVVSVIIFFSMQLWLPEPKTGQTDWRPAFQWTVVIIIIGLSLVAALFEHWMKKLNDDQSTLQRDSAESQKSLAEIQANLTGLSLHVESFVPLAELHMKFLSIAPGIPEWEQPVLLESISEILRQARREYEALNSEGSKRAHDIQELIDTLDNPEVKQKCSLLGLTWCKDFDFLRVQSHQRWQRYLEKNYELIRNGGIVRRVFLFSEESIRAHPPGSGIPEDHEVWDLVFAQWKQKVQVCIVVSGKSYSPDDRELRENLDYVIFVDRGVERDQNVYTVQYHEPDREKLNVNRINPNPYSRARRIWRGMHDELVSDYRRDFSFLEDRGIKLEDQKDKFGLDPDTVNDGRDFREKLQEILEYYELLP